MEKGGRKINKSVVKKRGGHGAACSVYLSFTPARVFFQFPELSPYPKMTHFLITTSLHSFHKWYPLFAARFNTTRYNTPFDIFFLLPRLSGSRLKLPLFRNPLVQYLIQLEYVRAFMAALLVNKESNTSFISIELRRRHSTSTIPS